MKTFAQLLAEAKNKELPDTTLTIFDIDATLFHTTARVGVVRAGKVIKTLSNQEFNTYELKAGETFDFGEFRSAEKFHNESTPIDRTIERLKSALNRLKKKSKIILLTAREDFDDRDLFLAKFKQHGINMDRIYVVRSGNDKKTKGTAAKKMAVIRRYMAAFYYDRINMYDDDEANLKAFLNLQHEYPDVFLNAFIVSHEGDIKSYK